MSKNVARYEVFVRMGGLELATDWLVNGQPPGTLVRTSALRLKRTKEQSGWVATVEFDLTTYTELTLRKVLQDLTDRNVITGSRKTSRG